MAIFGRRQPHAPIILKGLPSPPPPQSHTVRPFGLAATASARRPFGKITIVRGAQGRVPVSVSSVHQARTPGRPTFQPIRRSFVRPVANPPIGLTVTLAANALARRIPPSHVIILPSGGVTAVAALPLVKRTWVPNPISVQPYIMTPVRFPAGALGPPIGESIQASLPFPVAARPRSEVIIIRGVGLPSFAVVSITLTAQSAALAFRRPKGSVTVVKGGSRPIVSRMTGRQTRTPIGIRYFQPIVKTLIQYAVPAPVVAGRKSLLQSVRRFPPGKITILRGIGRALVSFQVIKLARTPGRPFFQPISRTFVRPPISPISKIVTLLQPVRKGPPSKVSILRGLGQAVTIRTIVKQVRTPVRPVGEIVINRIGARASLVSPVIIGAARTVTFLRRLLKPIIGAFRRAPQPPTIFLTGDAQRNTGLQGNVQDNVVRTGTGQRNVGLTADAEVDAW